MATFKATSKKKDNGVGVFKATDKKSYDASYVNKLEDDNRSSFDLINGYLERRKADGWMSEDRIKEYRDAIDRYKSSSEALSSINRSFGNYNEDDEKKWNEYVSSLYDDIDYASKVYGQYKNMDDYNTAIAAYKEREGMKTANLDDIRAEIEALEKQLEGERDKGSGFKSWLWEKFGSDELEDKVNPQIGELQSTLDSKRSYYDSAKAVQDYENNTIDELRLLAEEAVNNDDRLYYLGLANDKELADVEDKKVTVGGVGEFAGKTVMSGINAWNKGISSTADLILGKPLQSLGWENNPISSAAKYYDELYDNSVFDRNLAAQRMDGGKVFDILGQVGEGVIAAVPDALLAMMTAGASTVKDMPKYMVNAPAYAKGSNIARADKFLKASAYASGDKLTKAGLTVQGMMKNPNYWSSFARTYGLDYEEAKEMGASDTAAVFGATLSSLVNAGIEIGIDGGSGFQGFAQDLAEGNKNKFFAWVESSLEEGGEEILQGFVNNLVSKTMYDDSVELANLEQMVAEGAMGTAVGAILGGGQSAISKSVETAKANEAYREYGKAIIDAGGADTLQALANEVAGVVGGKQGKAITKLEGKVSGKRGVNAKALGKLSESVDVARKEQNKADIVKALESKGIDNAKAQEYADILFQMNEEFYRGKDSSFTLGTDAQWKKITGDENAYGILRSIVTDKDSPVNVRNLKHNNARVGIRVDDSGEQNIEDVKSFLNRQIAKATGGFDSKAETDLSVSEDGKAYITVNDDTVEVTSKAFVDGEDGTLKFKVNGDQVVDTDEVTYSDLGEAYVVSAITDIGLDSTVAQAVLESYKGTNAKQGSAFANNIKLAYKYGRYAQGKANLGKMFAVSPAVANSLYEVGQKHSKAEFDKAQDNLDTKRGKAVDVKGEVIYEGEIADENGKLAIDENALTEIQRASLHGIEAIAKLSPLRFHIVRSTSKDGTWEWVQSNGKATDANGMYIVGTNDIYIDLNAGEFGEGTMLYTVGHEVMHFIKDYSPKQWKAIADFLMEEYAKNGHDVGELFQKQIDLIKEHGDDEGLTDQQIEDKAYDEIVSDAMSKMFVDGSIVEMAAKLRKKDKGLWETFKKAIMDLLERWGIVIDAYKKFTPNVREAQWLESMESSYKKLQKMVGEAFLDASETFQRVGSIAEAKTNAETLATAGITVDADTGSAVMNSVRYAPKTQAEIDKVAKALAESMDVSIEKAKAWVKSETSLTSIILDPSNAMFLDYEADDRYEAIKKNAEYPQGTVDFSNLCKKRREFTALLDKLQKEHPNRIITAEEMEKIRQILIEENVEVACGLCYVEERRQLLGEIAQGFIDGYKNGTLKESIAKELDGTDTYVPTIYDLITYDGYRALTTEHPSIAKAFQKFNNARGMQAGRLIEGIAEYKRDILNWSQKKVDFVNSVGGLRVFSFSDFEATHLIDLVQVVQDCAMKGVMIQAYTKVPAFANAVKDTNMKVNRSLIAKGTGIKYENGRMVLDLDPVEGIDINDKDFFDSTDSESVGNVLVGMSNEQIRLAMKTPFVDYIIPFHTSLKGEILGAKKIDHWDNYKNFQTDKEFHPEKVTYKKDGSIKSDGWVVAENQINVYVDVIQAAEAEGKPIKNKVDFVNKFLAVAKEKGLKPRFWQFLDVDANGEYTYTEGYHKFLVDFKLFDKDGNILPQKPVVPVFDDALNARILNEYVAGKKAPVSRDAVYDRLEKEVINGVKKSTRNTGHSAKNPYNVDRANQEGDFMDEFHDYLTSSEWVHFYSELAEGGFLSKVDIGTMACVRIGDRLVFAERQWVRDDSHDFLVQMIVEPTDNFNSLEALEGLEDAFVKGGQHYDIQRISQEISRLSQQYDATGLFTAHNRASIRSASRGDSVRQSANRSGLKEVSRTGESGTPGKGVLSRDESGVQEGGGNQIKKFSRRVTAEQDAQYLELAKDPKKNAQALQEMVDETAKRAGYPVKAYHGTSSFGFTKFDPAMSDDKTTLFFTDDIRVASTYAGRDIGRTKSIADAKSFKYEKGKVYTEAELKEAHDFIQAKYHVYGETKINVDRQTVTHAGTRYSAKQIMEMADRIAKEGIYGVYLNTDNTLELDAGYTGWSGLKNPDAVRWQWKIKYQGDGEFDYFKAKADDVFHLELLKDGENVHSGEIQFSEMFSLLRKALGANRAEMAIRNAINHDIGSSRFMDAYSDKNGNYIDPTMNTREFAKYAKQKGYDGVAVKNLYDWGGKNNPVMAKFVVDRGGASTIYILFDSNRVKSADPVTYDDNGNVIPLSERFESSNDDIRYSRRSSNKELASIENTALYINNTDKANYIGMILNGTKTEETRSKRTLDEFIGKKVYVTDKKRVYGWVVLGEPHEYTAEEFHKVENQKKHRVPKGDEYDVKPGKTKWAYPIESYERFNSPRKLSDTKEFAYSHQAREIMYQHRGSGKSNRSLLANALESVTQHESEAKRLAEYKEKIDLINAEEQKLREIRAKIYDLSFAPKNDGAKRDNEAIRELSDEANKIANRINTYDRQLLRLEATAPLKALLEREKEKARKSEKQKNKASMERYRDNRHKTVVRNQIKRVTKDLDKLLNRGTKERNVKNDMQETVGSVLKLASVIFNDEITNEDIVLMGAETATDEEQILLAQYADLIKKRNSSTFNDAVGYIDKIARLNSKLADLFMRERARLNRVKVSSAIDELGKAYAKLASSKDGHVNFAYNEETAKKIASSSEDLGGTIARDMTLDQLEEVYKVFKMVKHMVSESNSLFRMGKTLDLAKMTEAVQSEILEWLKKEQHDPSAAKEHIAELIRSFGWNELKPVYAFERLGSESYMQLFWDAIEAEGVWAREMEEAKQFLDAQIEKTGYRKWNMEKAHEFTLPDGKVFKLTLQDMMSIYAYSKREQAYDHMTIGGFQFAEHSEYKDKDGKKRVHLTGDLYRVDLATIHQIIGELEKMHDGNVIKYADAVQTYLTEMGKKGNEVSRTLYGIDLFNETAYFPLMSSKDFRSSVETTLNGTQTQVSLKNTGMSKETVPHAENPIILQGFDDVVKKHIDTMSKYHAYVLPIENLRRVFDSSTISDDGNEYVSTKNIIKKVFGKSAEEYFDNYITDLNGGSFAKGYTNPAMEMFSKFKGTSVGASLSVIVQQPFAVVRALDMIAPKYLFGNVGKHEEKTLYAEIEKYAPVAVIKKMGGFDVGSSRTAMDYLGTRTDKGVKRVVDTINEAAMWGAGKADELGWGIIWKAVKREVASEQKLKPGTAEFFEACGKRFTEVITYTQVYDSVNSRSGIMRSKSDLAKFMTSFLGEPTTVINMAVNSMLKVNRAKGKSAKRKANRQLFRTMGVLMVSTLLTTIAKSSVYAMRDDDDDEAFLERWAKHTAGNLHPFYGDFNPMTMLPYARDIVSILEGFTVERPDITLLADVIASAKKMMSDGAEPDEVLAFIGDTCNMLGIPVDNIIRDSKAIINIFGDVFDNIQPTDIGGAFVRGITGEEQAKSEALYDAIMSGDEGKQDVIEGKYKNESSYESAVKKSLRENDPRIREALKIRMTDGVNNKYHSIRQEIINEGNFEQSIVNEALKAEYNYFKGKIEEAADLLKSGDKEASDDIIRDLKKKYKGTFSQDDILKFVKKRAGLLK